VFIHGDLQAGHVFVDDDQVTGAVDWSEASRGDALFDVELDLIRAWRPLRCLTNVRWLAEHGYGPVPGVPRGRRAAIPAVSLHEPAWTSVNAVSGVMTLGCTAEAWPGDALAGAAARLRALAARTAARASD
jgi:aminoglycoside phosphotransferase (APT) family kinase protein